LVIFTFLDLINARKMENIRIVFIYMLPFPDKRAKHGNLPKQCSLGKQ
jgi:hypothetical protein